jgi:hypothetical protein
VVEGILQGWATIVRFGSLDVDVRKCESWGVVVADGFGPRGLATRCPGNIRAINPRCRERLNSVKETREKHHHKRGRSPMHLWVNGILRVVIHYERPMFSTAVTRLSGANDDAGCQIHRACTIAARLT